MQPFKQEQQRAYGPARKRECPRQEAEISAGIFGLAFSLAAAFAVSCTKSEQDHLPTHSNDQVTHTS